MCPRAWVALCYWKLNTGANLPTSRIQTLLAESDIKPARESDHQQYIDDVWKAINIASRLLPFQVTCLLRSLVLVDALRSKQIPARLRIGVTKGSDTLQAHAWTDVAGQAIKENQSEIQKFSILTSVEGWPLRFT